MRHADFNCLCSSYLRDSQDFRVSRVAVCILYLRPYRRQMIISFWQKQEYFFDFGLTVLSWKKKKVTTSPRQCCCRQTVAIFSRRELSRGRNVDRRLTAIGSVTITGSIQSATKKGEGRGEERVERHTEVVAAKSQDYRSRSSGTATYFDVVLRSHPMHRASYAGDHGSPLSSSSSSSFAGRNLVNIRSPLRACITHVHTGRGCRLHKARWTPPDAGGSIERVLALLRSSCHDGHDSPALPLSLSHYFSLIPASTDRFVFPRRARSPGFSEEKADRRLK